MNKYNDNLKHYGIAGQKWGTRRWQNADGTFNEAGKERYFGTSNGSSSLKKEYAKVLNSLTNEVPKLENGKTDISNVMSRADLSENEAKKCIDIARKKLNEIKSVEPKVTKDILDSTSDLANMYGLEHRVKSEESLAGKIGSKSKKNGVSYNTAAKNIDDIMRYTVVVNDDAYGRDYETIVKRFKQKGYDEIERKNYFIDFSNGKSMHKGLQCVYTDGKHNFEVQYQTVANQAAKNLRTPLYEEIRKANVPLERRIEIMDQMYKLSSEVEDPEYCYYYESYKR